ncbi:MAG: phosphoribosyl-ATP diphosphatase [Hyphomicrobiales bacterium]|nr:phosphoribosyl-ATP diphosphatase [Hyphomicrobiales bacterium]
MTEFTLQTLDAIVADRAASDAAKSYTRCLLDGGPARAAKKFGEEAVEFAIAVAASDDASVRAEAADALFHLLVALRSRGVPLAAVMAELEARTARSGHEEKASRR